MKKTTIVGNIGNAAECRVATGGHQFISFSVAYADREEKDEAGNVLKDDQGNPVTKAQWADCEMYVKPGTPTEGLLKTLAKGRHIYLEAHDKVEAWIKDGEARSKVIYKVQTFEV